MVGNLIKLLLNKKFKNGYLSFLLFILSAGAFFLTSGSGDILSPQLPDTFEDYYKVVKVVDGDTLTVTKEGKKSTIRLIGIDAPEIGKSNSPADCYANDSKNEAKKYLDGQEILLESDPSQADKDRYGRLLRYIFLKDGTDFNKHMLSSGYAFEYTYDRLYKYHAQYVQAERDAVLKGIGFWDINNCDYLYTVD